MLKNTASALAIAALAFAGGYVFRGAVTPVATVHAAAANRVFELRTYTAPPGKLEALKARFRDHTIRIFNKYGMESIWYGTPQDAPLKDNTLIYILAHPSREAAAAAWKNFQADPEWQKARAESQKDGPLTTKTPDSVFFDAVDFSPIK
jgi:hypothetical protein